MSSNKQFAKTVKSAMAASGFVPMTDFEYQALESLVLAYGAKRICENARAIERDKDL
jgi:hypothetical protein